MRRPTPVTMTHRWQAARRCAIPKPSTIERVCRASEALLVAGSAALLLIAILHRT